METKKEKAIVLEKERAEFKKLMIENPNYFDTLPGTKIKPIKPMKANTKYEELSCIGFYPNSDLLEAIIDVKLPYGYSGNLCSGGSFEYVRFFVDWNGDGDFIDADEDVGIVSVNVHDIPNIPPEGLQYAVYLPVDLSSYKDTCSKHKVLKIRGILSWQTPPPHNNPNYNPVWGNKVDALIQLKPSISIEPGKQIPFITFVGGMAINKIAGNSETVIASAIGDGYANGVNALESPFGGVISICGRISNPPDITANVFFNYKTIKLTWLNPLNIENILF